MTDGNSKVHDGGQLEGNGNEAAALSVRAAPDIAEGALPSDDWTYYDFANLDDGTAGDLATGFTSMGYVQAALKRRMRLWIVTAVVGLLVGLAFFYKFPAGYQAKAEIMIPNSENVATDGPIADDQAMVKSLPVAGAALHMLGLHENVADFTGDYSATVVTDQVLAITVKAASSDLAVREAQALASAFLAYQQHLLNSQNTLVNATLQQQLLQEQQRIDSLSSKIAQVSAQPVTSTQHADLTRLRRERKQQGNDLAAFKQAVSTNEAANQELTTVAVKGTQLIGPAAPVVQHSKKRLLEYVGGGLVGGLALGMAIVIIGALVSDRLRRRSDVAYALGAPVRLSVGKIPGGRARRGLAISQSAEIRRVVAYLHSTVQPTSRGPASLAVIPVDDVQVPAVCLVSLAVSYAQKGLRVVVADLCAGSPAGQLLGATDPGVRTVTVQDVQLVAAIPAPDDVLPAGPLARGSRDTEAESQIAAACASADVLLTLASLDPSLGADHLGSWAAGAVAMVTVGRSTAARIRGVGEMTRLGGTPLISAVLIGVEKTDESLGLTPAGGAGREVGVARDGAHSAQAGFLLSVRGSTAVGPRDLR
jgi:capsular polysaccharide biosynthesis protein